MLNINFGKLSLYNNINKCNKKKFLYNKYWIKIKKSDNNLLIYHKVFNGIQLILILKIN